MKISAKITELENKCITEKINKNQNVFLYLLKREENVITFMLVNLNGKFLEQHILLN